MLSNQTGETPGAGLLRRTTYIQALLARIVCGILCLNARKEPRQNSEAPNHIAASAELLEFNFCACCFEQFFELVSIVFAEAFFHGFRRAFNEVFGFLQAQASDFANDFDNIDLLLASGGEDHVELVLLLSSSIATAVGVCVRTLTRSAISKSWKSWGDTATSSGTTTSRRPDSKAPQISQTEKSKAGEWHCVHTGPGGRPASNAPTNQVTLRWAMATPLGTPVVPDEYTTHSGCSKGTCSTCSAALPAMACDQAEPLANSAGSGRLACAC